MVPYIFRSMFYRHKSNVLAISLRYSIIRKELLGQIPVDIILWVSSINALTLLSGAYFGLMEKSPRSLIDRNFYDVLFFANYRTPAIIEEEKALTMVSLDF